MSNRVWVTLATNDSYGLGALVLAHSLRRASSAYPAVVLITPSVSEAMRDRLRAVFAYVVTVDVLDSRDAAHLALLQRPELGITFTKIHCWNLTQYEKCVFLDADTLVIQNCDELFDREELSAAPDVGWPDCFNSGVFVFRPSADTFNELIKFAQERGSFDGGDQGLLNAFFSKWAHDDINKHLPFLYNVTSAAFYSYLPALKHYGQNIKIIHFIGAVKPWLQQFNWDSRTVNAPDHLRELLQLWWDLFVSQVHTQLDVSMSGVAGNLARVVAGGAQREAVDELTRRQGWEAGNIDYMGADSFDNIWAKITQTLSQPRTSPPRQPQPEAPVETPEAIPAPVEASEASAPAETAVTAPAPVPAATTVPAEVPAPVAVQADAPVPSEIPVPVEVVVPVDTAVPVKTPVKVDAPSATAPIPEKTVAVPAGTPAVAPAPTAADVTKTTEAQVPVVTPVETPVPTPIPKTVEAVEAAAIKEAAKGSKEKTESAPVKSVTEVVEVPKVAPPAESPAKAALPAAPTVKTSDSPPAVASPAKASDSSPSGPSPVKVPASPPVAAASAKVSASPTTAAAPAKASDSPPLANTPSKEAAPPLPAAKSTEEAAQETRL